jgi:hypothetical protein
MEMPDATILSSRLPRVERKARPPCAGIFGVQRPRRAGGHAALVISGLVATFALIELAKFLRSVLRSSEILLQNDAMLRQAVRAPNGRITSVGNAVQSSEMMRNSLGLNYKSAALNQLSYAGVPHTKAVSAS